MWQISKSHQNEQSKMNFQVFSYKKPKVGRTKSRSLPQLISWVQVVMIVVSFLCESCCVAQRWSWVEERGRKRRILLSKQKSYSNISPKRSRNWKSLSFKQFELENKLLKHVRNRTTQTWFLAIGASNHTSNLQNAHIKLASIVARSLQPACSDSPNI